MDRSGAACTCGKTLLFSMCPNIVDAAHELLMFDCSCGTRWWWHLYFDEEVFFGTNQAARHKYSLEYLTK